MKLKGDWNSTETYELHDVVRWENGEIFYLIESCNAGTAPVETKYWNKIIGANAEIISMMVDQQNAIAEIVQSIPTNVSDEAIVLKAGENEYLVSIDDSVDTPGVIAELIEAEEGGE